MNSDQEIKKQKPDVGNETIESFREAFLSMLLMLVLLTLGFGLLILSIDVPKEEISKLFEKMVKENYGVYSHASAGLAFSVSGAFYLMVSSKYLAIFRRVMDTIFSFMVSLTATLFFLGYFSIDKSTSIVAVIITLVTVLLYCACLYIRKNSNHVKLIGFLFIAALGLACYFSQKIILCLSTRWP